jgi:hypothetical protein
MLKSAVVFHVAQRKTKEMDVGIERLSKTICKNPYPGITCCVFESFLHPSQKENVFQVGGGRKSPQQRSSQIAP